MFFINGSYVNEADANLSVLDLGILRGFGVFDYLRTYSKKPFHLREHLLRLRYSAETIGLEIPYSLEEIEAIIEELIRRSDYPEASLKIVATGGISSDQWTPQKPGTLIIFSYPLPSFPAELYSKGAKVITTRLSRSLPSCKTTQYIPGIVAMNQGKQEGAVEALYVNGQGEILEGTTSNFFGIKEGRLYTCMTEEVLAGITREVIIKLAHGKFELSFKPVHVDEIDQLDEAFITSSSREIMPVTMIDQTPIGKAQVGPVTRQLMTLFHSYTQQPQWPPLEIPRYAT